MRTEHVLSTQKWIDAVQASQQPAPLRDIDAELDYLFRHYADYNHNALEYFEAAFKISMRNRP